MFLCVRDKIYLNDKIILRRTPETIPFVEPVIIHIRCTHACRRRRQCFRRLWRTDAHAISPEDFIFSFSRRIATSENPTSPQSHYVGCRDGETCTRPGMETRSFIERYCVQEYEIGWYNEIIIIIVVIFIHKSPVLVINIESYVYVVIFL